MRQHTEFIENIRSMRKMIETDMGETNIDNKYYVKLDWWSEALISVIQEIDRKCETAPTILEKAIMDYIDSRENKRASLEAIVNACKSRDGDFLTINFVTGTIDRLRKEGKIELIWYDTDKFYSYRVLSRSGTTSQAL